MKFYSDREGFKEELSVSVDENKKLGERKRLPGVSLIVFSAGESENRTAFERHMESCSVEHREIIYADRITKDVLAGIKGDYVAIIREDERYIDDYALEVLVNTAAFEGADLVGGIGMKNATMPFVSDFVFNAQWLRENADILDVLSSDEQAFVAAAMARAGKHIVNGRAYTENVFGSSEPLISVIVPVYNCDQ